MGGIVILKSDLDGKFEREFELKQDFLKFLKENNQIKEFLQNEKKLFKNNKTKQEN
jgi:hypothetical protein